MISGELGSTAHGNSLRERYLSARPFPHLVLDDFLTPALLEGVLREFPAFRPELAVSENGVSEGKMVQSDIASLGPAFLALDELLRGPDFLALLSRVTRIEGLLADPSYYGGGVHCSLPGQELDLHLDFNRHPARNWRRRINVLLYLNRGWAPGAGGELELHSDPRDPARNQSVAVAPLANRLVIFETNESSWHGHGKIQGVPRASVAAYYYTDAGAEAFDPHFTVYADRPLTGEESPDELVRALAKRRTHLARLLLNEGGMLETLRKMNERAAEALERLGGTASAELAQGLDYRIAQAYEREKSLQRLIDALSDEIEALRFLAD